MVSDPGRLVTGPSCNHGVYLFGSELVMEHPLPIKRVLAVHVVSNFPEQIKKVIEPKRSPFRHGQPCQDPLLPILLHFEAIECKHLGVGFNDQPLGNIQR